MARPPAGRASPANFDAPMLIHGQAPPGVPVMKRLGAGIDYKFENIDRGARLLIRAKNPEAVKAVHEFLRFQITDHKTGDPLEPSSHKPESGTLRVP